MIKEKVVSAPNQSLSPSAHNPSRNAAELKIKKIKDVDDQKFINLNVLNQFKRIIGVISGKIEEFPLQRRTRDGHQNTKNVDSQPPLLLTLCYGDFVKSL